VHSTWQENPGGHFSMTLAQLPGKVQSMVHCPPMHPPVHAAGHAPPGAFGDIPQGRTVRSGIDKSGVDKSGVDKSGVDKSANARALSSEEEPESGVLVLLQPANSTNASVVRRFMKVLTQSQRNHDCPPVSPGPG
jgi:hypothetical protein